MPFELGFGGIHYLQDQGQTLSGDLQGPHLTLASPTMHSYITTEPLTVAEQGHQFLTSMSTLFPSTFSPTTTFPQQVFLDYPQRTKP